jgi:hypothetical protein
VRELADLFHSKKKLNKKKILVVGALLN